MKTRTIGLICIYLITIVNAFAQTDDLEIPLSPKGKKELDTYVNSIDQVERITGYDFFPGLPDAVEEKVEKTYDLTLWK